MMAEVNAVPVVLTIAGSDNSSGAGIQADLNVFQSWGVYGLNVITSHVIQTPQKVYCLTHRNTQDIETELNLLNQCFPIAGIKIGLVSQPTHIESIAKFLKNQSVPIVIDPVFAASAEKPFHDSESIQLSIKLLFPQATLLTPNLSEASSLSLKKVTNLEQMKNTSRRLAEKFETACLIKGGHLENYSTDVLYDQGKHTLFQGSKLDIPSLHGTGCTLSSSILALLSQKYPLIKAIELSKNWMRKSMEKPLNWEKNQYSIQALNPFTPIPDRKI